MWRIRKLTAVAALIVLLAPAASAWGPATHAYIAQRLPYAQLLWSGQKLYGAMAPDVNNFFPESLRVNGFLQTHYAPPVIAPGFLAVWDTAHTSIQKAQAIGFLSHNEMWGADSFAHNELADHPSGYVITKAGLLCQRLQAQLLAFGLWNTYGAFITLDNCHFVLEYGIDLLMKQKDPALGLRVSTAALLRSPEFPTLLANAYNSTGITPDQWKQAEAEFRSFAVQYGFELQQPDSVAIPLIAEHLAAVAAKIGSLPPVPGADTLIALALVDSMDLCKRDFSATIDAAVAGVRQNLGPFLH